MSALPHSLPDTGASPFNGPLPTGWIVPPTEVPGLDDGHPPQRVALISGWHRAHPGGLVAASALAEWAKQRPAGMAGLELHFLPMSSIAEADCPFLGDVSHPRRTLRRLQRQAIHHRLATGGYEAWLFIDTLPESSKVRLELSDETGESDAASVLTTLQLALPRQSVSASASDSLSNGDEALPESQRPPLVARFSLPGTATLAEQSRAVHLAVPMLLYARRRAHVRASCAERRC